ncbi:MAG: hypothetical protein RMY33_027850 [Nostoc sp. DedQUE03]|nr:hypothetical protein [Nostoc sp. DedQUE02]
MNWYKVWDYDRILKLEYFVYIRKISWKPKTFLPPQFGMVAGGRKNYSGKNQ